MAVETKPYWIGTPLSWWDRRPAMDSPLIQEVATRLPEAAKIVEVGCGVGRLVEALPPGATYQGIDLAPQAIAEARRLHRGCEAATFHCCDFLSYNPSHCHTAVCLHVLEHLPHFDAGLHWLLAAADHQVLASLYTGVSDHTVTRYQNGVYENLYSVRELECYAAHHGWKLKVSSHWNGSHDSALLVFTRKPHK